MGTIRIDGRDIPFEEGKEGEEGEEGDNVLKAALAAGVKIPHFCYHDALGSLGACRLCAVEITPEDTNKGPQVVMACLEPAKDGMQVSVSAPAARRAREGVIELLMTNHPHDCPVCDEGGECHLQEMTVACGPAYRRYRGRKRTFPNQYLGPLVHHEMNRCITCYRCTRFYRDYALGDDLGAMRLRNEVYFGRFQDGPLASPFAGNLVEVCPTGVFTDAVFRQRFTRVWDLKTAPSICPHCSVGCNTLPGARDGTLRRVRNRHHPEINRWFLCDRGRYGHQYSEHAARPLLPRVAGASVSYRNAITTAVEHIKAAGIGLGGLGSVREDMEGNALLRALMHKLDGVYAAFSDPTLESAMAAAIAQRPSKGTSTAETSSLAELASLVELEQADAALIVGDLTSHAPMMDMALRQAYRRGATLAVLHSAPTPLARFAVTALTVSPREMGARLSRLNELVADPSAASSPSGHGSVVTPDDETRHDRFPLLNPLPRKAPLPNPLPQAGEGANEKNNFLIPAGEEANESLREFHVNEAALADIAARLTAARRPLVAGVVETLAAPEIAALAQLATALGSSARLVFAMPGPNAYGAALLAPAGSATAVLEAVEAGRIRTLIVASNDPLGDARLGSRWRAACQHLDALIVLDCVATVTAQAADILIPVAAWAERGGTFVNYEGRAQGFAPVFQRPEPLPATAEVITDLARILDLALPDVTAALSDAFPGYQAPIPGALGSPIAVSPIPVSLVPAQIDAATNPDRGPWQAALTTWYGDDPLASFAPALMELAPAPAARIAPAAASNAGIEDGARVMLRGPDGALALSVQLDSGVAMDTIALARATLVQLGVGHGDPLDLEQIP